MNESKHNQPEKKDEMCSMQKLYNRYKHKVSTFVSGLLDNPEDRKDVLQDVWRQVFDELRGEWENISLNRLQIICRQKALDYLNAKIEAHGEIVPIESFNNDWIEIFPEELIYTRSPQYRKKISFLRKEIEWAFSALSERQRILLEQFYLSDNPFDPISAQYNRLQDVLEILISARRAFIFHLHWDIQEIIWIDIRKKTPVTEAWLALLREVLHLT